MDRLERIRYIRIEELSYYLRISKNTIRKWLNQLSVQVVKGKIRAEDLDILIKNKL